MALPHFTMIPARIGRRRMNDTDMMCEAFVENAIYILKDKRKLGDVERSIGLTTGYLSRCKKARNISLKTALELSDIIGMSIEELCKPNLVNDMKIAEIDAEIQRLQDKKNKLYGIYPFK